MQQDAEVDDAREWAKQKSDARRQLRHFAEEHGLPDPFKNIRARGHHRRERLDSWTAYALAFTDLSIDELPYSAADVWDREAELRIAASALDGDPIARQIDDAVRRILRADRERHEAELRKRWEQTEREAGQGRRTVKLMLYVAIVSLLFGLAVVSVGR